MRILPLLILVLLLVSCSTLNSPKEPATIPTATEVDKTGEESISSGPTPTPVPMDVQFRWSIFGREFTLNRQLDATIAQAQERKEQQAPTRGTSAYELERAYALRRIEEPLQQEEIGQLAAEFARIGEALNLSDDDIVRLSVAFVQQIPYDDVRLEMALNDTRLPPSKYPYQVLLNGTGVCDEKSYLLAALLVDFGYNTSIFVFNQKPIGHAAVGIACDERFSYAGTGYCFIETTRPTIITYAGSNYSNIGTLSADPLIIPIGGTGRFDASKDYADSSQYDELDGEDYRSYQKRLALISQYGLGDISCGDGAYLCNGQCWSGCADTDNWFHCTISGGVCYPPAQYAGDCPFGTNSCNKRCYETCGAWSFICTPEGGICRQDDQIIYPNVVLEYDAQGRAMTPSG